MHKGILAGAAASALLYSSLFGIAAATTTIAPPTCTISVPPGTHYIGQSVRLLWVAQGATTASISSIGPIPAAQIAQGYHDIAPTTNSLVTMTVTNAAASRTCSVLITMTRLPVQTQTVTQTVYQPVTNTQYVPTYVNSTWAPLNTWTPFWATPYSNYGSLYNPYYGTSYYYAGDYYNSFYNSSYVGGSMSNGYYYLTSPADCYYGGQCGQTGLYNPGYDWGTYSEQAAWNAKYNTNGSDFQQQLYGSAVTPSATTFDPSYNIVTTGCNDTTIPCNPASPSTPDPYYGTYTTDSNYSWGTGVPAATPAPQYVSPDYAQWGPDGPPADTGTWWSNLPQTTDNTGYRQPLYDTAQPVVWEQI